MMTKLSFILLLSSILCANAASLAQNVSLTRKDISFKEAFKEIKKQTGYNFLWAAESIKSTETIDVTLVDVPLEEAISQLLEGLPLTYQLKKETILIMEKEISTVEKVRDFFFEEEEVRQLSVRGTVTDTTGAPLPGVSVQLKGTSTGTSTDIDGRYQLENIPQNAVLIFSFLGYTTEEVTWSGQEALDMVMRHDLTGLDQVVVVGYGTQKRASITGAVSTVGNEKLTVAPVANVTNTLAGRLPGLITKQSGGVPGSDNSSLNIRGFGNPLIIVDGIESRFNNIDPNTIESISILKDASAAIYGARAGNGVILVTTKRGQQGKMNITYNTSRTFQAPTKLVKMASSGQMAELTREEHANSGKPEETQRFTEKEVGLFYAGTDPDYPNTDWWDVTTRDYAPQLQHGLAVRGGTDKIRYYGFLGYTDQKTLFKENGGEYTRYNIRSNVDVQVTDNIAVQFDLAHIWEDRDFPRRTAEGNNSIWQEYWGSEPYYNPTNPDGSLPYAGSGGAVGLHAMSNTEHGGYLRSKNRNLIGSLTLNYDLNSIAKGLAAKAFVNINQRNNFSKRWSYLPNSYTYNYSNDTYTQETFQTEPILEHRDNRGHDLTGQFSLNYNNVFNEHEISALALYEVIEEENEWILAGRGGYTSTAIEYLFNGGVGFQTSDGRASEMGRQAFISRINYAYRQKYLIEATLRIDQSAKFNRKSRTGYFPSVSLGWRISEEDFMKTGNLVNDLKLRLSYSEMGQDDVGNFQYLTGYQAGDLYYMGSTPSAGLISTGLANPLLTWEKMTIYNVGLDFSFFKGRLSGELDAFWRDREGIPGLRSSSLPSTFGAVLPTENLNSMNTRGFELSLGYIGNIHDFEYTVTGNISYSRSKWSYFDEPEYEDPDQERRNKMTGRWTDRRFGYVSEGLFTSQEEIDNLNYVYNETQGNVSLAAGDIRYKDINGDGLLDWKDQVEIGKGGSPNWIGGLNIDLAYKGIDLQAFFQGGFGFTQRIVFGYAQNFSELTYRERWTPENNRVDGLIPRLGGAPSNNWNSNFYQKKSDYMRLKSLALGYSFPQSLVGKLNIERLRIYLAGTNLLVISGLNKYEIDPEAPDGESGHYYPQMKTFSLGLSISL